MFSAYYFSKVYFSGNYFTPVDSGFPAGGVQHHIVGMLVNNGFLKGRW